MNTRVLKRAIGSLIACACGSALAQSAPTNAQQMMLHVTRSATVILQNERELDLWGTVDGQKVQLAYLYKFGKTFALKPGDYPVRLTNDRVGDRGVERSYEIEVLPGKTLTFDLVGLQE